MNALVINCDSLETFNITSKLSESGFAVKTIGQDYEMLSLKALALYRVIVICKNAPLDAVFPFVSKIRTSDITTKIPLILVTENYTEDCYVESLGRGFDDLIRVSDLELLVPKVRFFIDRAFGKEEVEQISKNGISLDLKKSTVSVRDNVLRLTITELKLLKEILTQSFEVVSRNELQKKVFGHENNKSRAMDVHLHNIRKKIEPFGFTIETVRSVGCRISSLN